MEVQRNLNNGLTHGQLNTRRQNDRRLPPFERLLTERVLGGRMTAAGKNRKRDDDDDDSKYHGSQGRPIKAA